MRTGKFDGLPLQDVEPPRPANLREAQRNRGLSCRLAPSESPSVIRHFDRNTDDRQRATVYAVYGRIPPMSSGDVAPVQVHHELRVTGRRRSTHRWMAVIVCVLGALVIVGSALPWTHYWAGGDTSPMTL